MFSIPELYLSVFSAYRGECTSTSLLLTLPPGLSSFVHTLTAHLGCYTCITQLPEHSFIKTQHFDRILCNLRHCALAVSALRPPGADSSKARLKIITRTCYDGAAKRTPVSGAVTRRNRAVLSYLAFYCRVSRLAFTTRSFLFACK